MRRGLHNNKHSAAAQDPLLVVAGEDEDED